MKHAITIDLEDWHQLVYRMVTGETIPPRDATVRATHRLLDLLDEEGTRATVFTVGSVAEAFPDLVREVARRGHEVGSHTHTHVPIYRMDRASFRADVERSRATLQDLTGQPVRGFRAPEFSIGHLEHWSLDVLAELGFEYDSSVFPIPGTRYGIPQAPDRPFTIDTPSGPLREYPLATWRVRGRSIPVAGGTYFRLLPAAVLSRALRDIEAAGKGAVLYVHPYEFHAGRLWLPELSLRERVRRPYVRSSAIYNTATGRIAARLRVLLRAFQFGPLGE